MLFKDMGDLYVKIVNDLYDRGQIITVRGQKTIEIINYNFKFQMSKHELVNDLMPLNYEYIKGEQKLFDSATNKLSAFVNYSKFWEKISDDNKTIRSAYGYIVKRKFGFDQIKYCISELKKDKFTRKAVITYKTPFNTVTKDNICTLSQQFFIRNNKLHCVINMRSNDIYLGLRNDMVLFINIAKRIADRLNLRYGIYYHNVGSLHMYEHNINNIKIWDYLWENKQEWKWRFEEKNENQIY